VNPDARIRNVPIVAVDGGPGLTHNGLGSFGFNAIPSRLEGQDDRIQMLLRLLDYLASPFGSEENLFLSAGIEGVHFEWNEDGAPDTDVYGNKLREDRGDINYVMGATETIFMVDTEAALEYQRVLEETLSVGIEDGSLGLYSDANVNQGPILSNLQMDGLTAIVTGREPFEYLDTLIQQWKDQGGEQIRQEYQEDWAAQS
jgi:putative aldouronate transport system substrate-binding protein